MECRCGVLKILEVRQNIVRKSASEVGVRGRIHFPGNTARLKLLGHGGVSQAPEKGRPVYAKRLKQRPAIPSVGVNRSSHAVKAVRIAGTHCRAEVVVTDRESVSHGIVKRKVRPCVVPHGQCGIIEIDGQTRSDKAIHGTIVPALMLRHPGVSDVMSAGRIRLRSVEMEWQQYSGR